MPESNVKSILAADCGTVTTTAILIEQVKGEFRLVASGETFSTYASPWRDITLGVAEAISQIEKKTDRTLLAPGAGWPLTPQSSHQQGVDAFIAVSSAGAPLRMVLAGLMQDITLTSARRAAATTYASVVGILSLDTVPNTGSHKPSPNLRHRAERRIQAIQAWQPEVILLTGGTDGGAERPVIEMANILSMAMRVLAKADKPAILFAGNSELRAQIAEILGPVAEFKSVDNIRPSLDSENLAAVQTELGNLYTQRKIFQLSGFQKLRNWSKHPVTPTGKSFEKLVAYIGRHNNLNVIGVNIGSGSTIVSTHVNRRHNSTIRSDAGVGHNLHLLLNSVTLEKFHRWLPISVTLQDLHNRLLNKSLRPGSIPTTFEELMIEHAVAREALRLAVEQARDGLSFQSSSNKHAISWGLIIGAGRTLTRTPHPGYAAMIMLDGIEPWGVTSLALDVSGTTNMLGAVASVQPMAAVEVAIRDTFLNLGTVIAPLGHGVLGKTALKLKIDYIDTYETDSHAEASFETEIEVPYGTIEVITLPPGQKATLEIRPTRHFDIGLGQPGRGAVADVEGGILGIIVDTRGRPLKLSQDDNERQQLLRQWQSKLNIFHANSDNNN